MEIMTNSSFQKPIIHKKVGLKKINLNKSNVSSVDVKWNTGCAIPKIGCTVGISDLITLPHKAETAQWNCFCGNVRNLLAVLSQSNDRIEGGLSSLTRRRDLGSWKGNLVHELSMMFQDVGYHTFLLPNEIDFKNLSYYAHLMKLQMVASMKISFNDDATKYGHIIGLCPYLSSGCFQLKISNIKLKVFTPTFNLDCTCLDAESDRTGEKKCLKQEIYIKTKNTYRRVCRNAI